MLLHAAYGRHRLVRIMIIFNLYRRVFALFRDTYLCTKLLFTYNNKHNKYPYHELMRLLTWWWSLSH